MADTAPSSLWPHVRASPASVLSDLKAGAVFKRHFRKQVSEKHSILTVFWRKQTATNMLGEEEEEDVLYLCEGVFPPNKQDAAMNKGIKFVLKDVSDVALGKQTRAFRRHVVKKVESGRCFSLMTQTETLDLEANSTDVASVTCPESPE